MTKMTKRGSKRVAFRIKISQDESIVSLLFAEPFSSMSAATSRPLGLGYEYCGAFTNQLATEITDASGRRIYEYNKEGTLKFERSFYGDDTFAMNDYVGLQERPVLNAEVISRDFQFCGAFDIRMVWRLLAYPGKGVISQYVKWTADIKQRKNDGTYVDVTGQAMGELTPYTEYWVRNDDDFMDDFSYSNESLINKTVGTIKIEAEAVYAENASKPWFSWPEEQMPSGELSMRRGKKLILSSENSNYVIKKLVVKWDCSCTPKKSEGSLSISNS